MAKEIIVPTKELILQVEDEDAIRRLIPRVFNPLGVSIESASTLEEAMAAVRGERGFSGLQSYTGMLLDIRLQERKVGHKIAEYAINHGFDHNRYPLILFSGGDLYKAQEETRHLKGLHLLQKPCALKTIVEAYLTNRKDASGNPEWFGL